jgi:hypothetical protein
MPKAQKRKGVDHACQVHARDEISPEEIKTVADKEHKY